MSADPRAPGRHDVDGAESIDGLDSLGPLAPGVHVEVFNRFSRRWVTGFEIAEAGPAGYRVRRFSDRSVLPVAVALHDVRAAHPSSSPYTRT